MKRFLMGLLACAVTAGVALGGVYVGSQISSNTAAESPEPEAVMVEEYGVAATGSIAIPGYDKITLKAGQRNQEVHLLNPAGNDCYFVISLLLADGTEIYKSGVIPPGNEVNNIKLSAVPAAGTYENAILRYSCWAVDGQAEVSGADTICTLEVIE